MDVVVVGAAIGQPVDQPRISVEGEDDVFVPGEQCVESVIAQSVRMFALRLQLHQVHDIDDANLQFWQMLAQDRDGGERLQRGHVATAGHDNIRFAAGVAAGPMPDADALGAVRHGGVHRQPLRRLILAGDDDVHIVAAAQTMIPDREQTIGIRRQIDAHDGGLFVHDVVNETGVLMREAVVHLLPDMRGQQIVQRRDGTSPRQAGGDFQPLGVLVEHRIYDVDERLVAIEQSVPAGEQIGFEPAFALMLAQHFHDATVEREELIVVLLAGIPLPVGHLEHRTQAIGKRFVRAEDSEVARRAAERGGFGARIG